MTVVSLIGVEEIYGISEGLDCFHQQTAEVRILKKETSLQNHLSLWLINLYKKAYSHRNSRRKICKQRKNLSQVYSFTHILFPIPDLHQQLRVTMKSILFVNKTIILYVY